MAAIARVFRRRPRGLIGAVVLVGLVELAVGQFADLPSRPEAVVWREADRAARSEAVGADVLILGDSLVKFGLLPGVLAERTGLRAVNLAVSGGMAASSDLLLEHALDAGARPRIVVLECLPRLLQLGPDHDLPYWPEVAGPGEALALAVEARDPELLGGLLLPRVLPTLAGRDAIRRAIAAGTPRPLRQDRRTARVFLRNLRANGGALVESSQPILADLDAWRAGYFPDDWTCHPVNDRRLRRLLDRAGTLGVRVVWVMPPVHPGLRQRLGSTAFDGKFARFLDGYRRSYPHLTIVDGRDAAFDPGDFWDPHHLARDGAVRFSVGVAAVLDGPAGPGLVALPDDGPGAPPAAPVEEFQASRLAVVEAERRR